MSSTTLPGGLVEPPTLSFGMTALVESGTLPASAQSGAVRGIVTQVSADLGVGRPLPEEPFISDSFGEHLPDGTVTMPFGVPMLLAIYGPGLGARLCR